MGLSIAAHDAFSRGNQLDVFYGDFEKAFDRVSHPILLKKLVTFVLGTITLKWIAAFLHNRGNYVKIGNNKSYIFNAGSGVGAGTSLGPLLFLLFINDITSRVKCKGTKISLFADDVKMYIEITSHVDVLKLKLDIARLAEWCRENKLNLNIDKCFIISLKRTNNHISAKYMIDGRDITRVEEIRDLGVLVDSRMNFISHIENTVAAARQTLGYIKWLSSGRFHMNTLKLLFTSYVRSKLEFAAAIWDPYQANYKSDIESIQKQFLLYLLGDNIRRPPFRIAPYTERCKLVQLQPLHSRRLMAKISLGYDILWREIDPTISSKLIKCNSGRTLRHNRILVEAPYRYDYSYHQPIASIVRAINQYSNCYAKAQSKNEFIALIHKILCDVHEPDL